MVKRDLITFILGMRDLGLLQDLSFFNSLIKLHDIFLDKMLTSLDKKVSEILETEDYNQLQVHSSEELFQLVDKYELDLTRYFGMYNPATQLEYPVLLPYSSSVVRLNELLATYIEENF